MEALLIHIFWYSFAMGHPKGLELTVCIGYINSEECCNIRRGIFIRSGSVQYRFIARKSIGLDYYYGYLYFIIL